MEAFLGAVGHLSDPVVLLSGAVLTGLIALAIAWVARRLILSTDGATLESHSKLADLVHGSLLAFTVFTLALVLADVRSNLGKTLDSMLGEASVLTRLDAELELADGPESATARQDLRSYIHAVVTYDWPALEHQVPKLSHEASEAMQHLRASGRAAAQAHPASAPAISTYLSKLEDFRFGRLESATKSVSNVFWWIIFAFLAGAMAMNGRHVFDSASMTLIFLHMAGIGLVLALIVVMDQPFRGETSVPSGPIARATGPEIRAE